MLRRSLTSLTSDRRSGVLVDRETITVGAYCVVLPVVQRYHRDAKKLTVSRLNLLYCFLHSREPSSSQ